MRGAVLLPAAAALGACGEDGEAPTGRPPGRSGGRPLARTPACDDGEGAGAATPEQTEGPFWLPSSPRRRSLLEPGVEGTRLALTGRVLDIECRPLRRALLDFWQADADGEYDQDGFRLRGHQLTDAAGRYRLETVVPGLYSGRTRHIHVKARAAGQRETLTTQLYFPNEPANDEDPIFDPALVIATPRGRPARFDFVL